MKKQPKDDFLFISEQLGKSKSKNQLVDSLTETVMLIEKELKKELNEEQIAGVVEYSIRKGIGK